MVAPASEEIVFRACMMPLLVPAIGRTAAVLVVPAFFGIAHLHHVVDHIHHCGKTIREAWLLVIVQLGYTSLFGMYSAFVFVRTGLVLPVVASHAFCNTMGLPDFGGAMSHERKLVVGTAFVAGLAGFILLLFPATDPSLYASVYYKNDAAQ